MCFYHTSNFQFNKLGETTLISICSLASAGEAISAYSISGVYQEKNNF